MYDVNLMSELKFLFGFFSWNFHWKVQALEEKVQGEQF